MCYWEEEIGPDNLKEKLVALGAEALAEGLVEFRYQSQAIEDLIMRLISTPDENVEIFKYKLDFYKNSTKYYDYEEVNGYIRELEMMLKNFAEGVDDPEKGLELAGEFFAAAEAISSSCDSDGQFTMLYQGIATDVFTEFASHCEDKNKVAQLILELNRNDYCGLCSTLIDRAEQYLPQSVINSIVDTLQEERRKEEEKRAKNPITYKKLRKFASQINDDRLGYLAITLNYQNPAPEACLEIAEAYLNAGKVNIAKLWINQIKNNKKIKIDIERDELLIEICRREGNRTKLSELLIIKFFRFPTRENFKELSALVEEKKIQKIFEKKVQQTLSAKKFRFMDAYFLLDFNKFDELEDYISIWIEQSGKNLKWEMESLAKAMEFKEHYLGASVILRSLLVKILKKGKANAYGKGVSYLAKINEMAPKVTDWKDFDSHSGFYKKILQNHKRKWSFWKKYKEKY
ncbi:MAG: DUF6880 family protein [Myxococcota bacterium]